MSLSATLPTNQLNYSKHAKYQIFGYKIIRKQYYFMQVHAKYGDGGGGDQIDMKLSHYLYVGLNVLF